MLQGIQAIRELLPSSGDVECRKRFSDGRFIFYATAESMICRLRITKGSPALTRRRERVFECFERCRFPCLHNVNLPGAYPPQSVLTVSTFVAQQVLSLFLKPGTARDENHAWNEAIARGE